MVLIASKRLIEGFNVSGVLDVDTNDLVGFLFLFSCVFFFALGILVVDYTFRYFFIRLTITCK